MLNAISLYFVMLIPTDSAAMRLSRMAMIARPEREFIRFSTMNRVSSTRTMPMAKVAALGVPVIPLAPSIITWPPSWRFKSAFFMAMWMPFASAPTYSTLITFLMISPKARVTMAR